MTYKLKPIVFAFLAIVFFATSCKTTKETMVDGSEIQMDQPLENALLWKIDGNGLTTPSYLFGTIHLIDADDYFLPNGTLAAIDNSKKMVFEIDMNEMSDMGAMMGMMNKAFMKDNKTLADLISEEDYKLVEAHFKELGLPLMMLERMKPMFLTVFASGDMDPMGLQSGSMKSYEMEFLDMAKNANKSVGGLETIEFQMSVFDSIPYTAQAEMLVETIKKGDTEGSDFEMMTQMYKDQKISDMVSMISDEDEQLSEYEDVLLSKRNQAWISGMKKMMAEMPTFFAVGAGHLAGDKGVINLLKKEGYKLTPISHNKS
ncbi:MAG: TraB/GumN family protein [Bacteroidota bacterium]